jgi:hypothetical protein
VSATLQQALDAIIEEAAISHAHKWRLVDDKGQVWCANEHCQSLALLPSLHCAQCLGAHYARHHITMPHCINREQQPAERKVANAE